MALGLALAAHAPASAQRFQGEVSLMSGGTFFLVDPPSTFAILRQGAQPLIVQNGQFKDAIGVGANAGVRIGDRVSVEGMFWWVPTELSAADGLSGYGKVMGSSLMYGGTVLYHFAPYPNIEPFVGVGAGAETMSYEKHLAWERDTDGMINGVVGSYFKFAEHLWLRAEVRDCLTRFHSGIVGVDAANHNDLMLSAGIAYRPGSTK
jgi:outer membrane protein W